MDASSGHDCTGDFLSCRRSGACRKAEGDLGNDAQTARVSQQRGGYRIKGHIGRAGVGYTAAAMRTPGATEAKRIATDKRFVNAGTAGTSKRRFTALATACESTGTIMGVDELDGVSRVGV